MMAPAIRLPAVIAVVTAVTGVFAGCPADPRRHDEAPVAVAGDIVIAQDQMLAVLSQRGVARASEESERMQVAEMILGQMIDDELVLAAAHRAGIEVTDEAVDREMSARTEGYPPGMFLRVLGAEQLTVDAYRLSVRRRMLQDAFLRARMATLPPISDADIQSAYDTTMADRVRPAQVRARQVLLRTSEEATHVVEQIRTRKLSMEQAATRFSQGLEASEGGDLGWFAPGDLPKVFDVCFILEPNQISDPIASEYGYHVFQVIDKREERIEPLSAVREQIYQSLSREQQGNAAEALMTELRAEHPVVISQPALTRVVALLPMAPVTPIESVEIGTGRPLDSHFQGADPIPPLHRE